MIMGKYSLLFFIVCFLFFIPGFSSAQVKITLDKLYRPGVGIELFDQNYPQSTTAG